MLKERLTQLFMDCDPVIQALISEVLTFEQENISKKEPRFKEEIDQIVSRLAAKEMERNG
jgi:hypothetical protein